MRKSDSQRFYGLHDDMRRKIAEAVRSCGAVFFFVYETLETNEIKERIALTPEQVLTDSSVLQLNRLVEVREAPRENCCRGHAASFNWNCGVSLNWRYVYAG